MAQQRDYYEVLGVDKNANADAIKKAYRNRPQISSRQIRIKIGCRKERG